MQCFTGTRDPKTKRPNLVTFPETNMESQKGFRVQGLGYSPSKMGLYGFPC